MYGEITLNSPLSPFDNNEVTPEVKLMDMNFLTN